MGGEGGFGGERGGGEGKGGGGGFNGGTGGVDGVGGDGYVVSCGSPSESSVPPVPLKAAAPLRSANDTQRRRRVQAARVELPADGVPTRGWGGPRGGNEQRGRRRDADAARVAAAIAKKRRIPEL